MTEFIMILAICRRILLGGDESDRVTIVEKPAESQQICVSVFFVASLYQPKQNNRNLIPLSTDAAVLCLPWSFHYSTFRFFSNSHLSAFLICCE